MFEDGVYTGPEDWKGDLVLPRDTKFLDLSKLKTVEGDLCMLFSGALILDNLRYVGGDILMSYSTTSSMPGLVEVKGVLRARETSLEHLPSLRFAGGLDLFGTPIKCLPQLESVSFLIDIRGKGVGTVDFPKLRDLPGCLYTDSFQNYLGTCNRLKQLGGWTISCTPTRLVHATCEDLKELSGIPDIDLVLHTGTKNPLIRLALEDYLSTFMAGSL